MPTSLDIHVASAAERRAAHANCHDVWSLGLPVDKHVARREASPLHQRARWIVGCLGSQVVCALASHPIVLRVHGASVPGMALASVHTLASLRGRGFAQQLLAWIEPFEHARGARVSTLFCDINPGFYARLGYVLCPSHEGWAVPAAPRPPENIDEQDDTRLVPLTADSDESWIRAIYDSDHGRRPLAVERPADYWRHLAARFPNSECLIMTTAAGERLGYVRVHRVENDLVILDHAVEGGDDRLRAELWRHAIALGTRQEATRVGGWLPDGPPAQALFHVEPRHDEITMVKPLDDRIAIDAAIVAASAWVQEIDHV
ncbi:MAG: GNAT family N-acetyltransferase [Planctomycetia bacterium]|nr:GNAT family N-acetyltransferase [Planctomycetia bacterium]